MVESTQKWIEQNNEASSEDYENKQKQLENTFNPIMMKVY